MAKRKRESAPPPVVIPSSYLDIVVQYGYLISSKEEFLGQDVSGQLAIPQSDFLAGCEAAKIAVGKANSGKSTIRSIATVCVLTRCFYMGAKLGSKSPRRKTWKKWTAKPTGKTSGGDGFQLLVGFVKAIGGTKAAKLKTAKEIEAAALLAFDAGITFGETFDVDSPEEETKMDAISALLAAAAA